MMYYMYVILNLPSVPRVNWSAQVLAEAGVTVETACASYRRNFSELYVDDCEIVIELVQ